jgi:mono/diheme cytochrome c family protein
MAGMVALRVRRHWLAIAAAIVVLPIAAGAQFRVTEREMHAFPGGVPLGWKFSLPAGDPQKGKKVFADLECYACHPMPGQGFPAPTADKPGPPLAGMGEEHPAAYFAESIVNPNAVLIDGPGYLDADGRSRMPNFNDNLTVEQLVDLVAYLKSLKGGGGHGQHQHHHGSTQEKVVGEYRVRIDYDEPGRARAPGFVRVFVSDAQTGTPVPYLPVRIRIGGSRAGQTIVLPPVLGTAGPHYGAPALMPDETKTVTVLIGPTTARVATDPRRYLTARQVSFEW